MISYHVVFRLTFIVQHSLIEKPATHRICSNCNSSCHIRFKKCPTCENEFPSCTKSKAKGEPKKNPANLLQILQKKVRVIGSSLLAKNSTCSWILQDIYEISEKLLFLSSQNIILAISIFSLCLVYCNHI